MLHAPSSVGSRVPSGRNGSHHGREAELESAAGFRRLGTHAWRLAAVVAPGQAVRRPGGTASGYATPLRRSSAREAEGNRASARVKPAERHAKWDPEGTSGWDEGRAAGGRRREGPNTVETGLLLTASSVWNLRGPRSAPKRAEGQKPSRGTAGAGLAALAEQRRCEPWKEWME